MDDAVLAVLAEYNARMAQEEADYTKMLAGGGDRDALLLSVGEDVARMMSLMVTGCGCKSILEVGTSYGYSTLWLAEAARTVGGKVTTLEAIPKKADYAAKALKQAGLADYVDIRVGDALEIIPTLAGPFDFVLLDLWKDLYVRCLELTLPKLSPGALILADNMLWPEGSLPQAQAYRRAVRANPRLSTTLLPIGQGVEVSRLAGPDDEGL